MKRIVLVGALAAGMLVGTASGLPFVNKRAVITEVVYVTETVADVIVYVDEDGKPYSTTTEAKLSSAPATTTVLSISSASSALPLPSPVPAPVMAESPSSSVPGPSAQPTSAVVNNAPTTSSSVAPTSPKAEAPTSIAAASPATSAQASPAAPSAPASNSGGDGSFGIGVTYDPYTGSQSSTQCKSPQEIASDFDKMASTFKAVRIYGSDCNLVPLAIQNALKHGLKIMGGAYLTHRGNGEDLGKVILGYKEAINQNAGGDWDVIQLFSVENERVNDRDFTASEVVDAINRARGQLRDAGYNGPIGAVETVPAMLDNPAICQAADVATVNCHAFFDTNTEAKNAGTFVKGQVERVKSACGGKKVIVTESGWPHQGDPNGKAVPSIDNQRLAINSIRASFNNDLFIHHAFDSSWKTDWAGSFNAERFWGVIP